MNIQKMKNGLKRQIFSGFAVAALVISMLPSVPASAASCAPPADYGQVAGSVALPGAATYRAWSRIMVPDATNNTYMLEIGGNCYTVGGGSLQAGAWVWVAYKDGNASSKIDLALSGQPTYKLIGNKPGVKVDRLVFTSDLTCVPTGDGTNCKTPTDTQAPSVQLTAPPEGGTVTGTVQVAATASDNIGVSKVEFYVNSALVKTSTAAPHTYQWDTSALKNGSYLLAAKAYDAAGNAGSDSMTVTVQNGDQQPPSVPGGLKATASAYNKVDLTWSASTDNIGVTGYVVLRDTVPIATLGNATSYSDNSVTANVGYSYQVLAFDKAGNNSAASSAVSVTTPKVPDSQAPTAPGSLSASAPTQSQVNLAWQASTDNIGVTGYDVYRSTGNGTAQKIASVTTTSFGDTGLSPSTSYSYYVIAKDGAGNQSQQSNTAKATTLAAKKKRGVIMGVITSQATGKALGSASVQVVQDADNQKHLYQANRNGKYRIGRLEPSTYNLSVRANGYRSASYSVKVSEGAVVTQDVKLQKR